MKASGAPRVRSLDLSQERIHLLERLLARQPLDAVLETLAAGLENAFPDAVAFLSRRDGHLLRIISGTPRSHRLIRAIPPVHLADGETMCSAVVQQDSPLYSRDISVDERWPRIHQWASERGLRSAGSWPVRDRNGLPVGTVCLVLPGRGELPESYRRLLREFATLAGLALEFHEVLSDAHHDARHDSLTGLVNRRHLLELLRHELSDSGCRDRVALLLLDLDDFKHVNDVHGHGAGDVLLGIFSERLRSAVRGSDTVARLGGDEFVVLMREVGSDQARETAQRVAEVLREPVTVDRDVIRITPSQGLALAADFPAASAEALLEAADAAMYITKQQGKDGLWMAGASATGATGYDAALLKAFENEALLDRCLLLESWSRWREGRVVGRQLVLGWYDEEKGRIPMHRLLRGINMAEVRDRLQHAIRRVVRDRMDPEWFRGGQVVAAQPPRSALLDPDYPGFLHCCLVDKSSPAGQMELDVSELLGDPLDRIRETLQRLRLSNPGLSVAIKALDRAPLSLEHLQAIRPDVLKVSPYRVRTQVQGRDNAVTVLQSLRLLGEGHGATVLADQVRGAEDLSLAEQAGIREWQGRFPPGD